MVSFALREAPPLYLLIGDGRGAVTAARDGLETGLFGEAQRQGIMHAGQDHDLRSFDQQAKSGRAFHVRPQRNARRARAAQR